MSEPKKDCGNWVRFVKTGASGLARAITGLRGDLTSSLANLPLRLCGLFRPLALAKSHAGAATVLVNEFDTSDLERTSYDLKGSSTRLTGPSLKLAPTIRHTDSKAIALLWLSAICSIDRSNSKQSSRRRTDCIIKSAPCSG